MKFTLSWLKEHLDTKASLEEITDTLTAIGLEVEEVIDRAEALAPFTVAQVVEAKPHPNADKLKLCQVDSGKETLQIVCGAPNATSGMKAVLAPVGSTIPSNGMVIKAAKIRDVESHGMLCSAAELGLGEDSAGIIQLPDDASVGKKAAAVMGLDDPIIDIAITPNRGDCLGVYGIARDLAAAGLGKLKKLNIKEIDGQFKSDISVSIAPKTPAPLFIGRHIRGVKNNESPEWLKKRLESIGLSPISALVDITNFLTHDLGRPAHVYDAQKLSDNLTVKLNDKNHKFQAIDKNIYDITLGQIVIADDNGPVALGGIIGGMESGCTENTTDVFLEIALFDPIAVAETGRALRIESDARYRFERGVDPSFLQDAAEIATNLICDLCGGEASELVIAGKEPTWQRSINLRPERIKSMLGTTLSKQKIIKLLQNIGCDTSSKTKDIKLIPPSWRPDLEGEYDIIEEIARLHGYDNILTAPLPPHPPTSPLTPAQRNTNHIRHALAMRGMTEVVSYSFTDSTIARHFGVENTQSLALSNPISSDLDIMRPSILPNLLQATARNAARDHHDIALFEIGPVFNALSSEGQEIAACGLRVGKNAPKNPHSPTRSVDVFDAKADAFAALNAYLPPEKCTITRDTPAWYHPGRSGALILGKTVLGYFGELHPAVLKATDNKGPVAGYELFLERTPQPKPRKRTTKAGLQVSNFQPVHRDFAFVVKDSVSAEEMLRAVKAAEKTLIRNIHIFDVYTGKGVEEGHLSLALTVTLQADDRTLKDAEIDAVCDAIITNVKSATGAELRG